MRFLPLELDGGRSVWPLPAWEQALAVEAVVVTLWRVGLHLPQALTPEDPLQNGATETARLSSEELRMTLTTLLEQLRGGGRPSSGTVRGLTGVAAGPP